MDKMNRFSKTKNVNGEGCPSRFSIKSDEGITLKLHDYSCSNQCYRCWCKSRDRYFRELYKKLEVKND